MEDKVHTERRFTVCMFYPMETFSVTEQVDTVAISKLTDIPSEVQVRQAISSLYKNKFARRNIAAYKICSE